MTETEADRYFGAQVAAVLQPGEGVVTGAYLGALLDGGGAVSTMVQAATKSSAFCAITDRRLILVKTRIGATSTPLLENKGVVSIERGDVKGVFVKNAVVMIEIGDSQMLRYQANRSTKHVSTQVEFLSRIESLLGRSEAAALAFRQRQKWTLIGLAVGTLLGAAYLAWFLTR